MWLDEVLDASLKVNQNKGTKVQLVFKFHVLGMLDNFRQLRYNNTEKSF